MIAETVKIVSTTLLGLTVGCAQCHDHRYDPISQEDYYRFRAIFEPAYDPRTGARPTARLISLWTDADRKRRGRRRAKVAASRQGAVGGGQRAGQGGAGAELPRCPKTSAASSGRPARRRRQSGRRSRRNCSRPIPGSTSALATSTLYDARAFAAIRSSSPPRTAEAQQGQPAEDAVAALTEVPGKVPVTHLFDRGDPRQPKQAVAPAS